MTHPTCYRTMCEVLGPERYTLYMQDYGCPVRFRMAWRIRTKSIR